MAHDFTTRYELPTVSMKQIASILKVADFHEKLCRSLPGDNLSITESELNGDVYRMARQVDLEVNLPDVVKKLLSGALRLTRRDTWDLNDLKCNSSYSMNLPASFKLQQQFLPSNSGITVVNHWSVDVKIPLIGNKVAQQIEPEIRRFHGAELDALKQMISC